MIPLALRFAARELRSGVKGFRIFLACLALGVAAIAAASSTAEAFRQGLASQAREILGGDLSISIQQRDFTPTERAAFAQTGQGRLCRRRPGHGERVRRRAAAGRAARRRAGLSAGRARVGLQGVGSLAEAFVPHADGAAGAAVEPALLDRLHMKLGDPFTVGDAHFVARAVLVSEPDRVGRFALGPRVLTSLDAIQRSGLLQPGGLFAQTARIVLPPGQATRPSPRAACAAAPRQVRRSTSAIAMTPRLARDG